MRKLPKFAFLLLFLLLGTFGFKGRNETLVKIDSALKKSLLLTPEVIELYSNKLHEILKNHDFKGNIVLALNGKVVFEECFGYADIEKKILNDTNTVFQLASVSKQFTAMGIAILNEKGLLQYDDLVIKYIPEFPYDKITIKHLLTHTSGLQNYIWLIENKWKKIHIPDNEDLIDLLAKNPLPVNFQPGTKFSYCNTGYAMLASIIERVSGKKYGVFLKENIFDVLCMDHTFVFDKNRQDTLSNIALGYVKRGGRLVHYENDNTDGILGDKGIYSCTEDLLKWDAALYSDLLLPSEALNELFKKNLTHKGDTIYYGMGWRLPKTNYPPMVYHNGWWHGYKASIRRFTEDKNTLIILNNTNQRIGSIINEIQSFLYTDVPVDTSGMGE